MSEEQVGKVVRFVQNGGLLMMRSRGHVDGFATLREHNGTWLIRSEVWAEIPLREYEYWALSFFRYAGPEELT